MRFSSALVIPALAATAYAHPPSAHSHSHARLHHQKRADTVITTGATGLGDGQVHVRLEISDLAARPQQYSLFIQAMSKFQAATESDDRGYYQIAGIHGVPEADWNGVAKCANCNGAFGYCPHDSVLFPAWHRAYMALYEQEFIKIALDIADSYPDSQKEAMQSAAASLRFPYWDWAANPGSDGVLPPSMTSPTVNIQGPNGQETVANPLYSFDIPTPSAMYYTPFMSWNSTLRYPTSNDASATSQEQSAINAFANLQGSLQDQVYNLLVTCDDYAHFSNDDAGSSSASCSNSLEGIHNTVHTTAGGPGSQAVSGGHMTYLPLAAFDALFWLHHTNVDRLFALWQTVHPESYGASQVSPHSTWTVAAGSTQDQSSPLEPFRKDSSNYWTTTDVEDWSSTFKYTYPEFATSDGSKSAIISYINQLYSSSNANLTAASISEMVKEDGSSSSSSSSSAVASSTASSSVVSSSSVVATTSSPALLVSSPALLTSSPATTSAASNGLGGLGGFGGLGGMVSDIMGDVTSEVGSLATDVPVEVSRVMSGVTGMFTGAPVDLSRVVSEIGGLATSIPKVIVNATQGILPSFQNSDGNTYEYVCNVETPRYALNGSYYVYVFDGQPSTNNTAAFLSDKKLIGAMGVLAGGMMMNPNLKISGSIPLTRYLQNKVRAGVLPDMKEETCLPYLTKDLNWKIVKDGRMINAKSVPGFQASVYSSSSTVPTENTLPQWAPFQPQVGVTKGKAGGLVSAPAPVDDCTSTLTVVASTWSAPAATYSAPWSSPVSPVQTSAVAPYYPPVSTYTAPARNASSIRWSPVGTASASAGWPSSTLQPYTGAASKTSFGVAGVLAAVAVVAALL